ncbi:helix-turn-helix domain-containing protein [Campylobacter upsaliensis]|nr:helix-turn-helix domain-containing protein [Campylobacter upsaliensis]EAJ5080193.1 helix-turn-helix domain-containing protein [Campylobacter upsaliensis]
MNHKTKGEILSNLLKKHSLSQRKLAQMLKEAGYDRKEDAISKYIRGERQLSIDMIEKIAKVLNENVCIFFDENKTQSLTLKIERKINCGIVPSSEILDEDLIFISSNETKFSLKALRANGNNMSPLIEDNDIIIYDSDENTKITHGDLVVYKFYEEEACKIFINKPHINIIELKAIQNNENFKTTAIKTDDNQIIKHLKLYKVVKIYKNLQNNQVALKLVKED